MHTRRCHGHVAPHTQDSKAKTITVLGKRNSPEMVSLINAASSRRPEAVIKQIMGQTPSGYFIAMNLDYLTNDKTTARMMRVQEEMARNLLQEAITTGEIREVDVTVAVKMLYSSLNAIARWQKPEHGSMQEVFEKIWDIFIRGMKPSD